MLVPPYYREFKCKAGDCRDSCCIGWELDIDESSYQRYLGEAGPFGERLRAHMEDIREDGEVFHTFRRDGQRCPFLNERNLCDICLELGEEALCVVCTEYPRYTITFNGRTERTLTLSCEEAARLTFDMGEPLRLVPLDSSEEEASTNDILSAGNVTTEEAGLAAGSDAAENTGSAAKDDAAEEDARLPEDDLFRIRERAIGILQDRSQPVAARIEEYLAYAKNVQKKLSGSSYEDVSESPAEAGDPAGAEGLFEDPLDEAFEERLEILRELEVLDEEWLKVFHSLEETGPSETSDFPKSELFEEHLMTYFTLRYFPQAADDGDVLGKARFCLFCLNVIRDMTALKICDPIDCVRVFCKEVEHSDENVAVIMEELLFAEYQ